ncbi:hypothetical protein ABH935_009308 [Catenulispora sp. GAS73]|uniref:hypothetical protein n=1 Tax=Catenulispora sp. GAS73 TaxID=3156269 RepID=UPI003515604D
MVDNRQIGVFAAYASSHGRALIDRELYLPKSWTEDPERCAASRILVDRESATKPAAGQGDGRPAAGRWRAGRVGRCRRGLRPGLQVRRMCESAGVGNALAVPKTQQVRTDCGIWRIDQVIDIAPDDAWEQIFAGDGAKGPRIYDWVAAMLPYVPDFDELDDGGRTFGCGFLARRSLATGETAYYMGYGPADTTIDDLVRVAGMHWAI